jgi:hypothetical protein
VEAEECPAADVHGAERRQNLLVEGGRGGDSFDYHYGGRNSILEAAGEQTEKWKHDPYDQTDNTARMTEEEQIMKVEALLAL